MTSRSIFRAAVLAMSIGAALALASPAAHADVAPPIPQCDPHVGILRGEATYVRCNNGMHFSYHCGAACADVTTVYKWAYDTAWPVVWSTCQDLSICPQ